MEIRNKMKKKVKLKKEINYSEFMEFMMANSDYNHEFWKMKKDIEKKLK